MRSPYSFRAIMKLGTITLTATHDDAHRAICDRATQPVHSRPRRAHEDGGCDSDVATASAVRSLMVFALLLPMVLALSGVVDRHRQLVRAREAPADEGRRGRLRRRQRVVVPVRQRRSGRSSTRRASYAGPHDRRTPTGRQPAGRRRSGANIHTVLNANDWYDDDNIPQTRPSSSRRPGPSARRGSSTSR